MYSSMEKMLILNVHQQRQEEAEVEQEEELEVEEVVNPLRVLHKQAI